MSNLALNQNQTFQTPMLGMVTMDRQPNTVSAQIDPASTATVITAGCAVKQVNVAGPQIMVDVTANPADAGVFGIIPYNMRKNTYVPGDVIEVVCSGGYLMLKASAAITPGQIVAVTNPSVATNDPTVANTTTVGDFVAGRAVGKAAAAGDLIKVLVQPGKLTAAGVVSFNP